MAVEGADNIPDLEMEVPVHEAAGDAVPAKKKSSKSKSADTDEISITIRDLPWSYLHLELITSPPPPSPQPPLDAITALQHLTSALRQFLGATGTAIPVDILQTSKQEAWIRVPRQDSSAVVAAVAQWSQGSPGHGEVAWRVRGRSEWLGGLTGGGFEDLFAV